MKTLTEKSLLINLHVSQWSARKYDRKATKEVNQTHGTKDAGRFNKVLIATEHLKAIQTIVTKARTFHYDNTLPWSDSGDRLLPSENYMQYTSELRSLKGEFETEVRNFIEAYPSMIEEAKVQLNGLFNHNDYPNDIATRFGINATFMPVPDVDDIRVNLSADEVQSIRESVSTEINERFQAAHRDIFRRVTEHLTYMLERLKDKDAVFRDSLFDNILPLVDLLPRLNVAGDVKVNEMCEDLRKLYVKNPDVIRENNAKRKEKAEQVKELLSKFEGFKNG